MPTPPDLGLCAHVACLWEATARKAGNVHPGCAFADLGYLDFLLSAAAVAPVFAQASQRRVGQTVLAAVAATRAVVRTNTNLGIVLLLAPLAAVPHERSLIEGIDDVLARLDVDDARDVYAAIRLVCAGGLGEVDEQDVRAEPTLPLRDVMALAQQRDLIAQQYVNGFREVLTEGVPVLANFLRQNLTLEESIVGTHLELLARHPDSLIARKRGPAVAQEASRRARAVLDSGWPAARVAFADLDAWLRADGNARNPGTSADLVTACLFAALREQTIHLPLTVPWSRP